MENAPLLKEVLPVWQSVWKVFKNTIGKKILAVNPWDGIAKIGVCSSALLSFDYSGMVYAMFGAGTFSNTVTIPNNLLKSSDDIQRELEKYLQAAKKSVSSFFDQYPEFLSDVNSEFYSSLKDKDHHYAYGLVLTFQKNPRLKKYTSFLHAIKECSMKQIMTMGKCLSSYAFPIHFYLDNGWSTLYGLENTIRNIINFHTNNKIKYSCMWNKIRKMTNPSAEDLLAL
jgi:hypothetical protein